MAGIDAVIFSLGGYFDAFDLIRPLGMAGFRPVVASRDPRNIAYFSRYCKRRVNLPPPERGGDEAVMAELERLAGELGGRPVLFYSSDPELFFIWKYQERLSACYRFLLPAEDLLEKLFDKTSFSLFAIDNKLPIPFTLVIDGPKALGTVLSSVRYPCIVKPAYSYDWVWDTPEQEKYFGWYKVALRRIETEAQLKEFCSMLPERDHRILIQSYVAGSDDHIVSFHGYFDETSTCLGSFMGGKIRTYPPETGGSVFVKTIRNEDLRKHSIEYLGRIGFRGIVKVDYKWDAADGDYKILEINPRYNLWEVPGAYAGVNLEAIAYNHQTGGENRPDPLPEYIPELRFLFFKLDFRSYFSGYRRSGAWTFGSYLRSLEYTTHFRIFNPADPLPSVVSAGRFVFRVIRRLARRLGLTS